MDFDAARSKVQGPAIGLMVFAVLSFLGQVGSLIYNLVAGLNVEGMQAMIETGDPAMMAPVLFTLLATGGGCLGMLFSLIILVAGLKMRDLNSYGLCMAGSVLTMMPCGGLGCCCCFIGLGLGGWSIMTLMKEDVKAAFQAQAAGAM